MPAIYIVEDDDSIREMLLYALASAGFDSQGFADDKEFEIALGQRIPDLILLDIMLPGVSGLALLQNLKQSSVYKQLPIIMLTAKSGEMDRVKGLDLGADDYIAKPFSVLEVISRIRAVLRRSNQKERSGKLRVGSITLEEEKRCVCVCEQEIILTFKEFELLYYMMLNEGIVLSRHKLLAQIWGFEYDGESRTVDMHIKSLRQKLGDNGNLIKTVRNVGYKIGG